MGSPDYPEPIKVWQQELLKSVEHLVSLPTGELFGLGPMSALLVMYSKEKGRNLFFPALKVYIVHI